MSEPRLISPLLDGYIMGAPISDHNGVRCCPALHKDTEEKFIVKIISIPASGVQLDALLLSGAYESKDAALRYFRDLADDTASEAALLQRLSRLEGFRSYDRWQIEPMHDGNGFEVYLISGYGNTLSRHLSGKPMTHLGAVNLGLDLCAAMAVCRRNGYLYVDLKPENIFLTEDKGYLIGDLGFIGLRSLKYASLPDKYRSAYTPPEIADAYAALNETVDIYAAGLILYQVFNDGQLPADGDALLPPAYADYEMAEIILKACAADPSDRWQDPQEMGQALISYMQRNTVNDTPIIPAPIPEIPEIPEIREDEEDVQDDLAVEICDEQTEQISDAPPAQLPPQTEESEEPAAQQPEQSADNEPVEEQVESETVSDAEPQVPDTEESDPALEESEPEQFVIDGFQFDETLPNEDNMVGLDDAQITDEVSQMLAQADELIAHKTPDPVVAPEAVEIPIPEPIQIPQAEAENDEMVSLAPPDEPEEPVCEQETPQQPPSPAEDAQDAFSTVSPAPSRRRLGCIIGVLALILCLLVGGIGGRYYYENEYLQHINAISLTGDADWLTITLDTDIDNTLLTVHCTDTYGNKRSEVPANNTVTFSALRSGTTYKITVSVSEGHQLVGQLSSVYTTPAQTSIVGLQIVAGETDGSAIVSFSVQGPDSSSWLLKYSADGVAEQTFLCTDHFAMLSGLQVGKEYTFRLVPHDDIYLVGSDSITFTPMAVILPQDLTVHGFRNGALFVSWAAPDGAIVEQWSVRCYNSSGVDLTFTTEQPQIHITGLDVSQGYTIEVKADAMAAGKWTTISAQSITFKDILLDNSNSGTLVITWPYEGTVPEGGWQLKYTIDGSEPIIVNCEKNTYTIEHLFPGSHYSFSFVLPAGIDVFGGSAEFDAPAVTDTFTGYGVTYADFTFRFCRAPATENWTHKDLTAADYTQEFAAGDSIGLVLYLTREYKTSPETILVTYILRDETGAPVDICTYSSSWTNLWFEGYCELTLPACPSTPGSYTLEILFNGAYITSSALNFTVLDMQ